MAGSGDIRAGKAYVEISAKDNIKEGMTKMAGTLKGMGEASAAAGKDLMKVGTSVVAPLALASKAFADMGSALNDASARTGVSVEALSELGYAAQLGGADMETLEGGITKMGKALASAAGGSAEANAALDRVGLSVDKLSKMSPEERFQAIAEGLQNINDPSVKAATAMELLGKSGTKLLPMMEGLASTREEARKLGITMSTADASAADEYGDSLDKLWMVLKRGVGAIGSAVVPALSEVVKGLTVGAVYAIRWVKDHREMIVTAMKVGAGIAAAGAALFAFGKASTAVGGAITATMTGLKGIASFASAGGALLTALLSPVGLLVAGLGGLAAYLLYTSDVGKTVLGSLGNYFGQLKDTALSAFGGIKDALSAGEFKLAADIAWAGIKLAFAQGMQPLREKWIDFKNFALDVWSDLTSNVAKFWLAAVRTILSGIAQAKASWENLTTKMSSPAAKIMSAADKNAEQRAVMLDRLTFSIDSKEAAKRLNDINARYADAGSQIEKQEAIQIAKANAERDETINQLQSEYEARKKILDAETALEKAGHGENADEFKAIKADLDQKRAEFEALTKKAADKKAETNGNPLGLPNVSSPPSAADIDYSLDKAAKRSFSVAGTFNSSALSGLGAGKAEERTAKNTEKMAIDLRKVANKIVNADPMVWA